MAYKMKGFSGFGNSPAKQGVIWGPKGNERMMDAFPGDETKIEKDRRQKKYRKPGESKYQSDVRRNKEQNKYEKGLPKANAEFYKNRKKAELRTAIETEIKKRKAEGTLPKKKKSPAKISDNKLVNLQEKLDHTQLDYRKPGWAGAAEKVGETLEAKGIMDGGGGKDKKSKKKKSEKRVIGPDDKSNPWWNKFENDSNNRPRWEDWEKRKHNMF